MGFSFCEYVCETHPSQRVSYIILHRYLSSIADACDQADIDIPFFGDNPKVWAGASDRMWVKWGAVLFHGSGADNDPRAPSLYLYPQDHRAKKGGNF